jgi:hypothetical protein
VPRVDDRRLLALNKYLFARATLRKSSHLAVVRPPK